MTKRRSLEIQKFSQENVEIFGGPRTESKFVKWFASRKRLRTADLGSRPRCKGLASPSFRPKPRKLHACLRQDLEANRGLHAFRGALHASSVLTYSIRATGWVKGVLCWQCIVSENLYSAS